MHPRVALLDVAPILAIGLGDVLRRAAIELVDDPAHADAVVVDLDRPGAQDQLAELRARGDAPTVLCCCSGGGELVVLRPGAHGGREVAPCTPLAVRSAVRRASRRR